jgi:lysophospholipase L1-like esterase
MTGDHTLAGQEAAARGRAVVAQPAGSRPRPVRSFLALGDSFSEGIGDPLPDGSGWRGWADRAAELMAAQTPDLRYGNLAIRGKLLEQVLAEQVPAAVRLRPDLVSIAAGGNDLLRPRTDPDALAQPFDDVVRQLTRAGSQVLLFTGFDPRTFPVIRIIRGRAAVFNAHLRVIARRYDCLLVDLWTMKVLTDPRMWAQDRLHLGPEGHRRVALRVAEVLGVPPGDDWREPLPVGKQAQPGYRGAPDWLAARRQDALWARTYAAPWVRRRLRGASSGDDVTAKRPELLPL